MKKAVMYGAGNIGRGFIGALFSQSGYEVTFIDVAQPLVAALNSRHSYPVRIVDSGGHEEQLIENVRAVDGRDPEAAAEAIAEADVMATAVGAGILPRIAPVIAAGLKKRFAAGAGPLNILICENLMDADKLLRGMLAEQLGPGDARLLDGQAGLVEASIGRMVPVQTPEMQAGDPLRVCVERYGFLPVDRDAFRGPAPEVKNMIPFSPFGFYLKRKLYIHNMGHATCAYLGLYTGREYIWQSVDDADTLLLVQNAMAESATALSRMYGVPLGDILPHIDDLLARFTNRALGDTCARVGDDTTRKLGATDRMAGALAACHAQGVTPAYIGVGMAGALHRHLREGGAEPTRESAARVLAEVSGMAPGEAASAVLDAFDLYAAGATLAELRRAAAARRAGGLGGIV